MKRNESTFKIGDENLSIRCPHCDGLQEDSPENILGRFGQGAKVECNNCGKSFELWSTVLVCYTTQEIDEN